MRFTKVRSQCNHERRVFLVGTHSISESDADPCEHVTLNFSNIIFYLFDKTTFRHFWYQRYKFHRILLPGCIPPVFTYNAVAASITFTRCYFMIIKWTCHSMYPPHVCIAVWAVFWIPPCALPLSLFGQTSAAFIQATAVSKTERNCELSVDSLWLCYCACRFGYFFCCFIPVYLWLHRLVQEPRSNNLFRYSTVILT